MAVLKGSVIGQLSGKLGDLAARIIDGRTILAQRPTSFHVNNSPTMVEIRQKFACTGAFVKSLLSLAVLYQIWLSVKEAHMSVFNYAFKRNFADSSAEKPTADNIITPGGFAPPVTAATVEADNVNVQLAALDTVTVVTPDERDLSVNGVICYYNPNDPEDAPFEITTINKELAAFDPSIVNAVDFPLIVLQQAMAAKYQNSILYVIVATKDADAKVVQYSAPFTKEN